MVLHKLKAGDTLHFQAVVHSWQGGHWCLAIVNDSKCGSIENITSTVHGCVVATLIPHEREE